MRARLLGGAALLALALAAAAAEPPRNAALHAIFDREFQNRIDESPEHATFLGIEGHNDRLADRSPAAVARRKAHTRQVIGELERLDPAKLSAQDRLSREMMLDNLRLDAEEDALYGELPFGARDSFAPVLPTGGPHRLLATLAKAAPFRHVRDYEDYLKRLEAVPRSLAQAMATMRAGMKSGWMPPAETMARVPAQLEAFAGADAKATPLWRPFTQFPASVGEGDRKRLAEAGERVLSAKVHPAFAELRRFVEAEYIPAAAKSLAASKLPAGEAYYAQRIRKQTTTRMTADEIHELGLREVARIRGEMDKAIAAAGFQGGFDEFVKFVNSDARFFYDRPEDRLRAYRDIAKRADAELPRLFAELPRTPYGIRPMDAYEGDNADNYSRPALDGSRAGFFNANVNDPRTRPSWEMEAVLLHETVPGHHLQVARAQELKGLPAFRRTSGYVAYGEGWALYAESLGYEMGFYKDPYMRFGALALEMLRACRLVIDTGVHARGWGREQSIRYLMENAAAKEGWARAEVDRYIVSPGQALGYKIGELRIKALRARAAEALGPAFDLRRFHNALLDDGPLPLTLLEARIEEWIAAQRRPAVRQASRR